MICSADLPGLFPGIFVYSEKISSLDEREFQRNYKKFLYENLHIIKFEIPLLSQSPNNLQL